MVLLLTKNLKLSGMHRLQPWFKGPFQVMSTGHGIYCLDLAPSLAAIHPWFYTSLLKPVGPQPAGPPALADDSYEVESILQINKHGIHTKVKWVGYDFTQNQWIQLSALQDTAPKVVKTFLRGKEQKRVSLTPRKKI